MNEPGWKEIYFNAPVDGEYTVTVIGTRAGTYTLHVGGYDVDAGERGLDGRRLQPR